VYETFDYVRRLTSYGVEFESYTEAHFRTTGPAGELMLAVAAWIAQQERLRLSERTKAGLQRAQRQGKTLGRKPVKVDSARVTELREAGKSFTEIAQALRVSRSVAYRAAVAS
jgi:putative DNA-invertase from lambdoid prophage Rac